MKKFILLAAALLSISAVAQPPMGPMPPKPEDKGDGFKFTVVKENPITSVKNQASSGTCWCFSSLSFIESEAIRINKLKEADYPDLSEMFVVSHAYADKAVKYVRVDGALNYAQGSSFGDLIYVLRDYGIVPNEVMPGLNYGTDRHMHGELAAGLKGYMDAILKNPNRKLSSAWRQGLQGILDAYLGPIPEKFTYKGKEYTPKSYFETLNVNLDDYIDFTSWTHLSYYEKHPVEVADNWRWEQAYNVPMEDMMAIIDNAIENGYTVAWASDVSETGFTRDGIGIVPDMDAIQKQAAQAGSDQARWVGAAPQGQRPTFNKPVPELTITPELRQQGYEEKTTTDDHGMHLYGIAKDQEGNKYYMVKNSWGETGKYKGLWYVSEAYVKYKTMDFMVHKDAIPKDIKKKLGIK
jgi:Aminopeptidase C